MPDRNSFSKLNTRPLAGFDYVNTNHAHSPNELLTGRVALTSFSWRTYWVVLWVLVLIR